MYLTEEEAKQKWCPEIRAEMVRTWGPIKENVQVATGIAANIGINGERPQCIASDCMMWRWSLDNREYKGQAHGYCGLGGRPE